MLPLQTERARSIRLLPKMAVRFTLEHRAIALKLALMLAIITVREAVGFLRLVDLLIGGRGSYGVVRANDQ
jgi:hypothetical protein